MPREGFVDVRSKPGKNGRDKWGERLATERRGKCTWSDAGAEDLLAAVVAVTEDGAALLLSKTSDGGALCIQVLSSSGRHRLYPASVAELNESLRLVQEIAEQ